MRRDLRWIARHPATGAYAVVCCGLAIAAATGTAYSVQSAVVSVLASATNAAVFIVPIYLAIVWGVAHDASIEEARVVAGSPPVRQRVILVGAGTIAALSCVLLALSAAFVALLVFPNPPPQPAPSLDIARSGLRLALTVLAAVTVSVIVGTRRSTVIATACACLAVLLHVLVQFTPNLYGQTGLKTIWPFSAATIAANAGGNYSTGEGLVAGTSLAAIALIAASRLSTQKAGNTPGASTKVGRSFSALGPARLIAVCAVSLATISIAAPYIVERLPTGARPSLILQRSENAAPEQVTEDFFFEYQGGYPDRARVYLAPGSRGLLERLPRGLASAGPGQSFYLEKIAGIDTAQVSAYLVAGIYNVCLTNRYGNWKIVRIATEACAE